MSHLERTVRIDAPPAVVWRVLTDVERWPGRGGGKRGLSRYQPSGGSGIHAMPSSESPRSRSTSRKTSHSPGVTSTSMIG